MSPKKFHLGWFTNFSLDEWNEPLASAGGTPWSGEFYIEFCKALERACFDYFMLEDTLVLPEVYGGNAEVSLKWGFQVPKHDPVPLAAVLALTFPPSGAPPFLLARLSATIDHISNGRFGWNIVTSGEDAAAQNFGMDRLPPRAERYDMADEYVDLVCRLFDSWDSDAVVMDRETGTYADFRKVRPINFEGK